MLLRSPDLSTTRPLAKAIFAWISYIYGLFQIDTILCPLFQPTCRNQYINYNLHQVDDDPRHTQLTVRWTFAKLWLQQTFFQKLFIIHVLLWDAHRPNNGLTAVALSMAVHKFRIPLMDSMKKISEDIFLYGQKMYM